MEQQESIRNFNNHALLTKREVMLAVYEWRKKLDEDDLNIALSKEAKEALQGVLKGFYNSISTMNLPSITKPNTSYMIDIFEDFVQLGITRYADGTTFDEDGIPMINMQATEDETEDEDEFRVLMRRPVPAIPLKTWAKQNGINYNTARAWSTRKRFPILNLDGRDIKVSAIQYIPNALYEDPYRAVKLRVNGRLPENIVKKYPELSGIVAEVMITHINDSHNMIIISRPDDTKGISLKTIPITDEKRTSVIKDLLRLENVRSVFESTYQSPVGDAAPGAKFRGPSIQPGRHEIEQIRKYRITGSSHNEAGSLRGPDLEINITDRKTNNHIITLKGRFVKLATQPEQSLLQFLMDDDYLCDYRNRVLASLDYPHDPKEMPWFNNLVVIREISPITSETIGTTANILRLTRSLIRDLFGFDASLLVVALQRDENTAAAVKETMREAKLQELYNGDEPYEEACFYGYLD